MTPGRREAVERWLTPDERAFLEATCKVLGLTYEGWLAIPTLRDLFVTLAVRRAAVARGAQGQSWERAIESAAIELGDNPETYQRRWSRWRRESMRGAEIISAGSA